MTPPEGYVRAAALADVPENEGLVVSIDGEDVALFRLGEEIVAVENTCPHQGASLAEGWIEGETVSCPWHAWCFELRTGRMTLGDYAGIAVYDAIVNSEDAAVYVSPTPKIPAR